MTTQEALAWGAAQLKRHNIKTAQLDASLLLGHAMKLDRAKVLALWRKELSTEEEENFTTLIHKRLSGLSVAVIVGSKEFYGLQFLVNRDVLIPRPETEILVDKSLELIDSLVPNSDIRILDLCTGSGCIAIALKHLRPHLAITAIDLSPAALEIARANERNLLAKGQEITWLLGNLFDALPPPGPSSLFDIIVSNPPYIAANEIPCLAPEVLAEPRLALIGGSKDGLDIIRKIIAQAPLYLKERGSILIEAGGNQGQAIAEEFKKNSFINSQLFDDLAGIPRVSLAYRE